MSNLHCTHRYIGDDWVCIGHGNRRCVRCRSTISICYINGTGDRVGAEIVESN